MPMTFPFDLATINKEFFERSKTRKKRQISPGELASSACFDKNSVSSVTVLKKSATSFASLENAGLIAPDKMTELMKLTAKDVNDVVVILTGATESINRLFGATGDAKDKFTHQINMEGISTQDMLAIAKGYFKQQGFKTDDSVEGTVKNLLMAMESGNIDRMLKACDEAMLKCDDREKAKGSSRKYLLSEDFK